MLPFPDVCRFGIFWKKLHCISPNFQTILKLLRHRCPQGQSAAKESVELPVTESNIVFDFVRSNEFSSSLEKCWFRKYRIECVSYCRTPCRLWAYCSRMLFRFSTTTLLCAFFEYIVDCPGAVDFGRELFILFNCFYMIMHTRAVYEHVCSQLTEHPL